MRQSAKTCVIIRSDEVQTVQVLASSEPRCECGCWLYVGVEAKICCLHRVSGHTYHIGLTVTYRYYCIATMC